MKMGSLTNHFRQNISVWTVNSVLIATLLLGAFLRFHNSYEYLRFGPDEARDIKILASMWRDVRDFDISYLPTKGPSAAMFFKSTSNQAYHGAFYYYFMLPIAVISGFHPYGLALFVIFLNITAVFLMFLCAKELLGPPISLVAAFMLSISSFAVFYSRWAWNPNLIIFFTLLAIFAFIKLVKGNLGYWPLLAFGIGALSQTHALGYFINAVVFIPLLVIFRPSMTRGRTLWLTALAFSIPLLPTILHETLNGFPLAKVIMNYWPKLLIPGDTNSFLTLGNLINSPLLILQRILNLYNTSDNQGLPFIVYIFGAVFIYFIWFMTNKIKPPNINTFAMKFNITIMILTITAVLSVDLALWKNPDYHHNHIFLFFLPFVIINIAFLIYALSRKFYLMPIALSLVALFSYYNLSSSLILSSDQIQARYYPTFKDQLDIVNRLNIHTSDLGRYILYIPDPIIASPLKWLINRYIPDHTRRIEYGNSYGDSIDTYIINDGRNAYLISGKTTEETGDMPFCRERSLLYTNRTLNLYSCP